jgi:zinc protease
MKSLFKLYVPLLAFFFAVLVQPIHAQNLSQPIPMDDSIRTGVLPNGMTYYIRRNHKPENRAELRLAVNVGSMEENDDQQGLAHFNEHMAFDGTQHFKKNEIIDFLEKSGVKFGADLNAYTSFDETVYKIQVPTDSQAIFNKAIQILDDWTYNLEYDSVKIEKERGVVISERRLGLGAFQRMEDKYWPILFKDSRYAERIPIGKLDVLQNCKHATLEQFRLDWYRPELMAVIVVGDFDVNKVEKMVIETFSKTPVKPNARPLVPYPVPDNKELLIAKTTDKEMPYNFIEITVKHDKEHERTLDDMRRDMIHQLFSTMLNDRLQELQKQTPSPFSFAQTDIGELVRTKDAFNAFALVKSGGVDTGLEVLLTAIEKVKRFGFTPTEFDRAKEDLMRQEESQFKEKDKTESKNYVEQYVDAYLEKEPVPGIEFEYAFYKKNIDGIKIDEVNQVAKDWITDNGQNTVIVIQSPQKDSASLPTDAAIKAVYTKVKSEDLKPYVDKTSNKPLMAVMPTAGKVTEEKQIKDLGITEWKLSNGIKVVLKPTDFKNDEVVFNAYRWGGNSLYPDNENISATFSANIEDQAGIGAFNSTTLDKMLQGKIVEVSPQLNELSEGFNGKFSPQDIETAMQLINLYFTQPRKDDTAYGAFMDQMKSFIQNRSDDPSSIFQDTIQTVMSQHSYRRRPMSLNVLNEADENTAFNIYKERFSDAGDFTFFFVGSFTLEQIKPLVELYLASLTVKNEPHSYKDLGIKTPTGVINKTVYKGTEPKSSVQIVFTGPAQYSIKDQRNMQALSNVLDIMLRMQLRQQMSGVYGVYAAGNITHYPKQEYKYTIAFGCDPKMVDTLTKAAFLEIDSLKRFGASDVNLRKIKESFHRERESALKENSFWLNAVSQGYKDNTDVMAILTFDAWVDSLTSDDIKHLANQYFNMSNYAKFILMPEK